MTPRSTATSRSGHAPLLALWSVVARLALADTGASGILDPMTESVFQRVDMSRLLQPFSVSGFSSGATMAAQLFAAFPDVITGMAQLNGAPYSCSAQLWPYETTDWVGPCHTGTGLNLTAMVEYIEAKAAEGSIGDLSHWSRRPIYLRAGDQDSVVNQTVVARARDLYSQYSSQVFHEVQSVTHCFAVDEAHAIDTAGNLLGHLLSPLRAAETAQPNNWV